MLYTEYFTLRDCSRFLQIRSHILKHYQYLTYSISICIKSHEKRFITKEYIVMHTHLKFVKPGARWPAAGAGAHLVS